MQQKDYTSSTYKFFTKFIGVSRDIQYQLRIKGTKHSQYKLQNHCNYIYQKIRNHVPYQISGPSYLIIKLLYKNKELSQFLLIFASKSIFRGSSQLLYICYTYSDIEVGLCFKALVSHLALEHVARARVILMQKITNSCRK